ncbi:polyprenyl synthetase family protein [Campylobacter hyointestinalis]|uniref:Polyprenyl synthetase n=1 Tax=Campylobacter hyointestinalis subsp. hyointestinalis TaxID=91352 RepID=A0A9W5EQ81_CAMHY|nr:polyprenyl synthetase family protein [Campylobacter hyointestinalis]PPB52979.1 octaprenyl-diphosphate synthase [Campylobacter hyointestinalis subsp. hyointestinalis]PPB54304.1 octaprenyl-diphosphate synthase [Campylobacter hyointestinalis subsp. hyointestinalis]PPB63071.1 octaprenyl-diphosphate synthase [Campylobacter hyointestinalis subsp. hyointestinalis]PPB65341.1 octaprenyl-diphosphate synthase [Campylobacter hyointestinalis subsp. hyointestinalis]PPB67415.1 octaprenyl-diphosphate synth
MDKIDSIMNEFVASLGFDHALNMFSKINSGKKLRSKLILKIAGLNEASLKLCAVIEIIHLASLLHDDVIDSSDVRRGSPSINALFGTKNAIMLGDILYSKGFNEIVKFDTKIADIVSEAVCKLSIGEMMDTLLGDKFNTDKEKYLKMIYLKTAVLIEASARSAAVLAGLDEQKYAIYGKNLGLAFQIVDDILDITQDSLKLGKPAMNDYKEGKTTLPYIFLYDKLLPYDKEKLTSLFKKELNSADIAWIKDKFNEFDIINLSINYAKDLGNKATSAVNNGELKNIVTSMIDRDF